MSTPFSPPLGAGETLGGVYENPALGDHGSILMVDLAIAPVGLGAIYLNKSAEDLCIFSN